MSNPTPEPDPQSTGHTVYSYDVMGRKQTITDVKVQYTTISTYDADGRLVSERDGPEGLACDDDRDKGPEPDSDPPIII
jgi:hypothetical protein